MFSRTRAQRQKADTAKQMARLFPVDPILVLERLDAAATAQLAACCAGARDVVRDGTRIRRLAARRWSWPQHPKSGNDDLVTLDDLRSMDDLERALSQWRLMRARAGRPVPRFTDGFDEACLLVHARRRVALELVGASNGWYRWSADFEKGERPATGTPPSWVETTQNWDADWPDFETPALTLEGEMRRDAQHLADLLPGNWRLSVCQGTVAIQNGGVWLQLTGRGFRCAQCHDTERGEYAARYEVSHGPVAVFGGAARSRALGALAPGPWPRSDDPETTELQGAAFDVSASDDDDSE